MNGISPGSEGNLDLLEAGEAGEGLDVTLEVLEAKLQDFFEVSLELIEGGSLGVAAGDAGDDADIELCFGVPFHVRGKCFHVSPGFFVFESSVNAQ